MPLLFFILVSVAIWFLPPSYAPWGNEIISHTIRCLDGKPHQPLDHCFGTSAPSKIYSTSYRVHADRNEVTFIQNGKLVALKECTIHDKENWECVGHGMRWNFNNGIGGLKALGSFHVSRFKYRFEKLLHFFRLKRAEMHTQ